MKVQLLVVGNTTAAYLQKGIEMYSERIRHYLPFEIKVIADIKNTAKMTSELQKQREGELLIKQFAPGDFVVLLDERGKEFTSREFSQFIERKMNTVARTLWFVVGGPYGFSTEVYNRADDKMSLSKFTFPHELVRLFFVEQLYRAMTIMRGEPYHHD